MLLFDDQHASTSQASTDSIADFARSLIPVASSIQELIGLLIPEAQVADRLASPAELPPVPPGGADKQPHLDRSPVDGTEATLDGRTVFVFRHRTGQPDTFGTRPLQAAHVNDGRPIAARWEPPTISWTRPDTNAQGLIDALGTLVARPEARAALEPILGPYGEWLELQSDSGPLFAFRCLNVVDALDPDVGTIPGRNGFVDLAAHRFVPDRVAGAGVFTVPQQPRKPTVFFSGPVVGDIVDADVTSLPFTPVWR